MPANLENRSGHRQGKGEFSFQSQRRAMPKNVQTTTQLYSSHTLVKWCSKFSKIGFNSTRTMNFQIFKLEARKGRGTRGQFANIHWIIKTAKEFQKKKKKLFLLYWLCQSLWLCGSQQTVENSLQSGNTRPPDLPLEKSVCRSGSSS